jgi:hypothetical protein
MDEQPLTDAFDGKHLLVADKPCDECLFSRNKLVDEARRQVILRECYERGTYFICHKATLVGRAVICHNFAKSTDGAGNVAIRVATFFNCIKYVEPGCPSESLKPPPPRTPRRKRRKS